MEGDKFFVFWFLLKRAGPQNDAYHPNPCRQRK